MKVFKLTLFALMFSFSGVLFAQDSDENNSDTEDPTLKSKAVEKGDAFYNAREYVFAFSLAT